MAKSWIVPGIQGPVKIVLRPGGDAGSLAGKVSGWLRSPALRPIVFSMFEEVSGRRLDPARITDAEIQKIVRPTVENALQSGRLVFEAGAGEAASAKEPEKEQSWVLPSPEGKLRLGLGKGAGAVTGRLHDPERLVDGWLSSAFAFGTLAQLLREVGIFSPGTLPKDKLRSQLLELIANGKIVRLRDDAEGSGGGGGGSSSSKSGASGSKDKGPASSKSGAGASGSAGKSGGTSDSAKEPQKKLSWVRFQLVDEAGKALDDEYYEIKLTDGKSPKGKWPKGQAEQFFDQIPEGTCTISFPKLKDNGWKAPGKK